MTDKDQTEMLTYEALFTATDNTPRVPLHLDEERALILEARGEKGQRRQPNFDALLDQFIPALRGAASAEYKRLAGAVSVDEVRSNVLAAFSEAVYECDEGVPLAAFFKQALMPASHETRVRSAVHVPAQRRSEYADAMREAGDDLEGAIALLAGKLSAHSVRAIHGALAGAAELDADVAESVSFDPYEALIAKLDAARALAALPATEKDGSTGRGRRVVRRAYGFDEQNTASDEEIAEELKQAAQEVIEAGGDAADMWTPARRTVAETRQKALATMHSALCDGTDPRCYHEH